MLGFLNLHKPVEFTSHDCVGKVRRLLAMKRVGHGGTLDPLATGVLPIALGPATRLLPYLPTQKAYRAVIRLGMTTTTDDLAGKVVTTATTADLSLTDIEQALEHFQGQMEQVPPVYSAIQVQGQRCYDLARQGKPVPLQPRLVEIFEIQILDWRPQAENYAEVEVVITCGPGTYIRSIARELGAMLKTGGTLAKLSRIRSCGLTLEDSLTFEALEAQLADHRFVPLALDVMLPQPIVRLPAELAQRFCWGQKILGKEVEAGEAGETGEVQGVREIRVAEGAIVQVHGQHRGFLGMGQWQDRHLKPKVVIHS